MTDLGDTMNILLVGDCRDYHNWGARGTSTALSQIIGSQYTICGTINGEDISDSPPVYNRLGYLPYTAKIRRNVYSQNIPGLLRTILGKKDFISSDPSKSIDNILRYRSKDRHINSLYERVYAADSLVINGEGSMIFKAKPSKTFLFQLAMIELATRLEKPVFHVNALASDCSATGRNEALVGTTRVMMKKCSAVALRDPVSYDYLRKISPEANAHYIPDAIFAWHSRLKDSKRHLPSDGNYLLPFQEAPDEYFDRLDFSRPYVCVSGSSSAARDQQESTKAYTRLVNSLKRLDLPLYLTPTCRGDRFLYEVAQQTGVPVVPTTIPILSGAAILANSELLVSGRLHPSMMASLGGTPCIFLGSDSHKTQSLQQMLGYPTVVEFSDRPTEDEVDDILSMAFDYLGRREEVRTRISDAAMRLEADAYKLLGLLSDNGIS